MVPMDDFLGGNDHAFPIIIDARVMYVGGYPSIKGLFAEGEVTGGVHGDDSLGN